MMGTPNGQARDHAYRQPMCRTAPPAAHSLFCRARSRFVIPAKAGIHFAESFAAHGLWIPAPFGCAQGGLRRNDRVSLRILPCLGDGRAPVAFPERPAVPFRPQPDHVEAGMNLLAEHDVTSARDAAIHESREVYRSVIGRRGAGNDDLAFHVPTTSHHEQKNQNGYQPLHVFTLLIGPMLSKKQCTV